MPARKKRTRAEVVKRGEVALQELAINAVTMADQERVLRVRQAMEALDEEQAETKEKLERLEKRKPVAFVRAIGFAIAIDKGRVTVASDGSRPEMLYKGEIELGKEVAMFSDGYVRAMPNAE